MGKSSIIFILIFQIIFSSCTQTETNPQIRRIKQSIKVIEDNVNGRVISGSNILEVNNFFYNSNGTLDSVTVLEDTSENSIVLKTIKFNYYIDKIILQGYIQNSGSGFLEFHYNSQKQITKIIDSTNCGLYFTYLDDKIFEIKDTSVSGVKIITNFIYDLSNNLTHYEFKINDEIFAFIDLEYNTTLIPEELDTRFFNKDIKIIYIGGLNLVAKLGLDFGIGNRNMLVKRKETLTQSGQIFNTYLFKYEYNSINEIIKRSMEFNEDTLYYRFNY